MNKGYLIAHVTVTDPAAYAEYANAAGEALQGFNPRVIVWSGEYENLEGEAHKRFYNSPGYVAARKLRAGAATGTFVVVEGA